MILPRIAEQLYRLAGWLTDRAFPGERLQIRITVTFLDRNANRDWVRALAPNLRDMVKNFVLFELNNSRCEIDCKGVCEFSGTADCPLECPYSPGSTSSFFHVGYMYSRRGRHLRRRRIRRYQPPQGGVS